MWWDSKSTWSELKVAEVNWIYLTFAEPIESIESVGSMEAVELISLIEIIEVNWR